MSCEKKFYKCSVCGNLVEVVNFGGGTLVCCGQDMDLLVPNTVDAAVEKHVPVIAIENGKVNVKVGSVTHPMTAEHYIQWICLCSDTRTVFRYLKPGDAPEASFCYDDPAEKFTVYEYCNLHGLWSASV